MRPLVIAAAVLLSAAVAARARAETRGAVDWIFLVDTSKSMRGVGGSQDIFGDVKESLRTFVHHANDGDSVSLYTFDRDVTPRVQLDVRKDRSDLLDAIDRMRAEGDRTHLGAAIAKGLDRADRLKRASPDPTRTRAIVLFTDGKEDVRGIEHPISIPSNVARAQVTKPFIFFVSMGGEHEAQLDTIPSAKVVRATDAEAIRNVAQQIRTIVQSPPPPPPVQPPLRVQPTVERSHPLRWLAAAAVLLVLALIAFVIVSGKMPGELLESITQRKRLEGELEIVAPRTPAGAAFVGLPSLKANEVALSSIVPPDALGGSDARLFVRRKDGEKRVWIESSGGSLRVNDIEVPAAELYDADTIRIGDAKLRFNRVGHQRPEENL